MTSVITVTINPALDVFSHTPRIIPTHKLRCDHVQRHAGGGGVNIARVLHRLGVPVQALVTLGGTTGGLIAELLGNEGVDLIGLPIAGHTRESFTVTEGDSGNEFRFVLPGPELARSEWMACLDAVEAVVPRPAWVVASGSLPPGVPFDFYAQLAQRCRGLGLRLIVDTSGPALGAALDAGVYLVKPSVGEMRSLSGLPLNSVPEMQALAASWVVQGKAEVVVVSMGAEGALLVSATESLLAPALPVTVVSGVGAGDSFVAGMVAGHLQGHGLPDAFRWGVACASAAIQSTSVGGFGTTEVQLLLPQVVMRSGLTGHV
jgi:6-phosphofructokinase 2